MNNITPIEALITDTVQKFETDLCRAVAKVYDEDEIITDVEVNITLETANPEDVIEDAVQNFREKMRVLDKIFGEGSAQEMSEELEDMLQKDLRKDLIPNDKTLEALRKGMLVHPMPKEPMVDDGKESRPYMPPVVKNARTKALECLIMRLIAYGAPAEFFTGKSEKEIMEGLATLLKMHMEAVNLARKILRKDR